MEYLVLLGRDNWTWFNTWSHRTLSLPHKLGGVLGDLTLRYFDRTGEHTYTIGNAESDQVYLVYSGEDVISLTPEPQGVPVHTFRRGGDPAFEGCFLLEMSPQVGFF